MMMSPKFWARTRKRRLARANSVVEIREDLKMIIYFLKIYTEFLLSLRAGEITSPFFHPVWVVLTFSLYFADHWPQACQVSCRFDWVTAQHQVSTFVKHLNYALHPVAFPFFLSHFSSFLFTNTNHDTCCENTHNRHSPKFHNPKKNSSVEPITDRADTPCIAFRCC